MTERNIECRISNKEYRIVKFVVAHRELCRPFGKLRAGLPTTAKQSTITWGANIQGEPAIKPQAKYGFICANKRLQIQPIGFIVINPACTCR